MSAIASSCFIDAEWEQLPFASFPLIGRQSWEIPESEETIRALEELSSTPTVEKLEELRIKYPGYNLCAPGHDHWTTLALAINKRALPLVQRILDLHPELLNGRWRHGVLCHHEDLPYIVTAVSDFPILREFVLRGAHLNLASRNGLTALAKAALDEKHPETTYYLIRQGAVIYNKYRYRVLIAPARSLSDYNAFFAYEENIKAASIFFSGANRFLDGTLSTGSLLPLLSLAALPKVLREHIWSYLTGISSFRRKDI